MTYNSFFLDFRCNKADPGPLCSDEASKKKAEERCALLDSSLFESCHNYVDVAPFKQNCEVDTCVDPDGDSFCEAIEAYAKECQKKGVLISWRTEAKCGEKGERMKKREEERKWKRRGRRRR